MVNILDWKFQRLITPVLMQIANGFLVVAALITAVGGIVAGLYHLVSGAEKLGMMLLFGGIAIAVAVILISRLVHEVAIVTFRIANVSKEVNTLMSNSTTHRARAESASAPAFVPPVPPPLP